jgi:hypothetical protein
VLKHRIASYQAKVNRIDVAPMTGWVLSTGSAPLVEAVARCCKELGSPGRPGQVALVFAHHGDPPRQADGYRAEPTGPGRAARGGGPAAAHLGGPGRRLDNLVGDPALAVLAGERLFYDDRSVPG